MSSRAEPQHDTTRGHGDGLPARRSPGPGTSRGALHWRLILSAGSINADFEVRVDARPEPAKTSLARDLLAASGGKAANVAVIARRLGVPARLVGCVGDDERADQALAGPVASGVDATGVRRTGAPTAVSTITVTPDGEKTIVLAPGANDA
jgi:ribokinase